MAAYGLTRRDVLGYCGDRRVEVYRRTTPGRELATLGGTVLRREARVEFHVSVPAPFARFVQASDFEGGLDRFRTEIRALGSCDSPVRKVLEDNLIAFATGRTPIPLDPASPEMHQILR